MPRPACLSEAPTSLTAVTQELAIMSFATRDELWSWLAEHHDSHPGLWVQVHKSSSLCPSVTFHELNPIHRTATTTPAVRFRATPGVVQPTITTL